MVITVLTSVVFSQAVAAIRNATAIAVFHTTVAVVLLATYAFDRAFGAKRFHAGGADSKTLLARDRITPCTGFHLLVAVDVATVDAADAVPVAERHVGAIRIESM